MRFPIQLLILALIILSAAGLCKNLTGYHLCAQTPAEEISPSQPSPSVTPGAITTVAQLLQTMSSEYKTVQDYSLIGYIKPSKGMSVIDYRCVRSPLSIRSEIIDGSGKGTAVIYNPQQKKDQVKAKSGNFRVWRSIERLKLQNTPAVESMLDTVLNMMSEPKNVVTFKGLVSLTADLGQELNVTLKPETGPAATETVTSSPFMSPTAEATAQRIPETSPPAAASTPSMSPTPETGSPSPATPASPGTASEEPSTAKTGATKWTQPQTIRKDCYLVEIKGEEFTDTVAIDANTFWFVFIKRMKGDDVMFEALVLDLTINTSPKMDF